MQQSGNQEVAVASFRQELEKRGPHGIPSLDDVESGKLVGAVLPMSEKAQIQMRNMPLGTPLNFSSTPVVWQTASNRTSASRRLNR